MTGLALLLLAAAVAHALARLLRVSPLPLLVVTGYGLWWTGAAPEVEMLRDILELGLVVLVFAAGVEVSPRRLRKQLRPAVIVGLAQFLVLGLGGWLVAIALGFDGGTAWFVALALAASSTLVVTDLLKKRQQMFEPFGRLTVGVLLLQDGAVILALVILNRFDAGVSAVALALGALAVLVGAAWVGQRWIMPWLARRHLDDEALLLGVLAWLFVVCSFGAVLGVPLVAGAFAAGVALSGFPINGLIRGFLGSISEFSLALFFVTLGALFTMPSLDMLVLGLVLAVLLVVATVPLVTFVAERAGMPTRAGVESGLLLSQTSEFSLVIALYGMASGYVSQELFSLLAALTVGTMAATPALSHPKVADALVHFDPRRLRRKRAMDAPQKDLALFVGLGAAGERVLRPLVEQGRPTFVIDEDAGVVRSLKARGINALQADGSQAETLAWARAREAAIVLCSMPRPDQAIRVARYLRGSGVPLLARVFDPLEAVELEALGAVPVVTADAAVDRFMDWGEKNGVLRKSGTFETDGAKGARGS